MIGIFAKIRIMIGAATYKHDVPATTYLWVISFKAVDYLVCI